LGTDPFVVGRAILAGNEKPERREMLSFGDQSAASATSYMNLCGAGFCSVPSSQCSLRAGLTAGLKESHRGRSWGVSEGRRGRQN